MKRTVILSFVVASAFGFLSASAHSAQAQSEPPKFEVGGQFSLLNFDPKLLDRSRRNEIGGGGRFNFNFHKYVAAGAQFDYFPDSDSERIGILLLLSSALRPPDASGLSPVAEIRIPGF